MPKEPRGAPPSEDGFTGASLTAPRAGFYFPFSVAPSVEWPSDSPRAAGLPLLTPPGGVSV